MPHPDFDLVVCVRIGPVGHLVGNLLNLPSLIYFCLLVDSLGPTVLIKVIPWNPVSSISAIAYLDGYGLLATAASSTTATAVGFGSMSAKFRRHSVRGYKP